MYRFIPAALLALALILLAIAPSTQAAGPAPQPSPTDGFKPYTDTFTVQHPYDLKESDRFSEDNGIYTCWVQRGDKPLRVGSGTGPRTEMRWAQNWSTVEHIWEGDAMWDPGSNNCCIMQVKSNTGGEAIYLNVQNNNLVNSVKRNAPLIRDGAGKWFHLMVDYNPVSGAGKVWVNGKLTLSVISKRRAGTVWYFKNGVYNTAALSKSHFKNIKFWEAAS